MPLSLPQVEQIRRSTAMSNIVPSNVVEGLVSAYVELAGKHERFKKELETFAGQSPISVLRSLASRR